MLHQKIPLAESHSLNILNTTQCIGSKTKVLRKQVTSPWIFQSLRRIRSTSKKPTHLDLDSAISSDNSQEKDRQTSEEVLLRQDIRILKEGAAKALEQKDQIIRILQDRLNYLIQRRYSELSGVYQPVPKDSDFLQRELSGLSDCIVTTEQEAEKTRMQIEYMREEEIKVIQSRNQIILYLKDELEYYNKSYSAQEAKKMRVVAKLSQFSEGIMRLKRRESLKTEHTDQLQSSITTQQGADFVRDPQNQKLSCHNKLQFPPQTHAQKARKTIDCLKQKLQQLRDARIKQKQAHLSQKKNLEEMYQKMLELTQSAYEKRIRNFHKLGDSCFIVNKQPHLTERMAHSRRRFSINGHHQSIQPLCMTCKVLKDEEAEYQVRISPSGVYGAGESKSSQHEVEIVEQYYITNEIVEEERESCLQGPESRTSSSHNFNYNWISKGLLSIPEMKKMESTINLMVVPRLTIGSSTNRSKAVPEPSIRTNLLPVQQQMQNSSNKLDKQVQVSQLHSQASEVFPKSSREQQQQWARQLQMTKLGVILGVCVFCIYRYFTR